MTPALEQDALHFREHGFIILRDAIPPSLIRDLRRECDKAVTVVRATRGPQAQRFQPIRDFCPPMDPRPFRDYAELPGLWEAFRAILGSKAFYGLPEAAGVFIEPAAEPWSAVWHRDLDRQTSRFATDEEFADFVLDWDSLNQINAALYNDDCTWYVPGSHLRAADTLGEVELKRYLAGEAARPPEGADAVAVERHYLDLARRMPGAQQVHLFAGDLLLYRAYGWHCGNYVPYRKRATILDVAYSPAYYAWRLPWLAGEAPKWKPEHKGRKPLSPDNSLGEKWTIPAPSPSGRGLG